MNETTIKINGKNTLIQFGTWVIQELIEKGYELETLGDEIKRNPFKFIPLVIYLGACNAKNMDLSDYELKDFYKFIDKEGFNSKVVSDVITLFTKSMTTSLGVDEKNVDEIEINEKVTKKKSK